MNETKLEKKCFFYFSGNRVMGIVPNGVISNRINAQPEMIWPVPHHWSLEDAATVPLAYCFAYYCLVRKFTFTYFFYYKFAHS